MYDVRICGTGIYRPKRKVEAGEIRSRVEEALGYPLADDFRMPSRSRYFASPRDGETATFIGMRAADNALEAAGMQACDLDLIINASGTAPQAIPDGAALLQRELGLGDSGIPCMTIHATCLSFLAALRLVSPLIHSGEHKAVLIVSSDIASVGINWQDPESAFLFGDGAAAAVLTPSNGDSRIEKTLFRTFGSAASLTEIRGGGSSRHPNFEETVESDNLFDMDGEAVLAHTLSVAPEFLSEFGADPAKMDYLVPHQASKSAMYALEALGWDKSKIANILGEMGNCVAASMPLALAVSIDENKIKRGDRFVLLGTGAGLSMGGAIVVY